MNRFTIAVAAIAGAVTFAPSADAQIRVGPFGGVNVRVPFVSVDVLPFGGGTRVRAPFTSVGTGFYGGGIFAPRYGSRYGGYGYDYRTYSRPLFYDPLPVVPVPVYPAPRYFDGGYDDRYGYDDRGYVYPEAYAPDTYAPTPYADVPSYETPAYQAARPSVAASPADSAFGSTGSLEGELRRAAVRLRDALSQRRDDADIWLDYLSPDQIIETIDRGGSPSDLKTLLLNYEGLSGNSQLSALWLTDGFRQTHRLLRQFVETQSVENQPTSAESSQSENSILDREQKAEQVDEAESLPVPRPTTPL